jgi:hypothetical protein
MQLWGTGYKGEAEWCPEASSRGDVKQQAAQSPRDARAAKQARTGGAKIAL